MVSVIISRLVILVFGLLYPAYNSYKAVKTKNVKEYVKWMMYWIVFAFFTCVETFADLFLSWVPFYYELKILFVLWLLSPATKGSSYLYRKFLHPQLAKREKEIDNYISKASDEGYTALLSLGSKGINYATNVVLTTAIKGQTKIVDHLKKSYSLGDISQSQDSMPVYREDEDETDNRIIEESYREEMGQEPGQPALSDEIRPRRKGSQRSADLYSVDEGDEVDNSVNKSQPRPKRSYSHKEDNVPSAPPTASQEGRSKVAKKKAYHYGTLPRTTRSKAASSRPSVKNVKY